MTHDPSSEPQESPTTGSPETEAEPMPAASGASTFVPPVAEEVDLNNLYPDTDQDLNELFPEQELRDLLKRVHKSKSDIAKMNTRFVDDTDNVVPHLEGQQEETS